MRRDTQVAHASFLRWFVVWNFLYAQRHPDVHYVYYKLLPASRRGDYLAAGKLHVQLPKIYQVSYDRALRKLFVVPAMGSASAGFGKAI